jgi:hypothetical protein
VNTSSAIDAPIPTGPDVRVLVVGGAGFIGSHLVDRLLAEQHTVDVVDDLSTGSLANLATARSMGGELKIHHLDAGAPEFPVLVSMREPEVIYHLGWAPPGRHDPATEARAVLSTLQVLEAARAHDVRKVVTALPSTVLYGEVPSRELPVKEGRPWSPVGATGVVAAAVAELFAWVPGPARRGVLGARARERVRAATARRRWGGWRRSPPRSSRASRPSCTATDVRPATSCSSTTWSTRSCGRPPGGAGSS